jgi:hypothetical protein
MGQYQRFLLIADQTLHQSPAQLHPLLDMLKTVEATILKWLHLLSRGSQSFRRNRHS